MTPSPARNPAAPRFACHSRACRMVPGAAFVGGILVLAACSRAADARSGGAGHDAWTAALEIPSAGAFSAHDHRVAELQAGPDGALHALFLDDVDGDGQTDRLLYAGFDGAAWSRPLPLDDTPGVTDAPALVVQGDAVHLLWLEAGDLRHLARLTTVMHRVRSGGQWSEPAPLYRTRGGESIPNGLAAVRDGGVHAVHHGADGRLVHRVYGESGWGSPRTVGGDGMELDLVAGPGGTLAAAGTGTFPHPLMGPGGTARNDPWVRIFRGGRWTEPVPVHHLPAEHSHTPRVRWTRDGVLHAVWLEGEHGELLATRLLHATSRDGRSWSAPVEAEPRRSGGPFYSPRLAVDGRGTLHLTFARFRAGMADPRHFHATFDGARWSLPREILPGEGVRDSELETAVDGEGRLHAVWKAADGGYRHAVLELRGGASADPGPRTPA
ncbi:MAG TPA: hypothetical protein VHG51_01470 [Longimicrobiaceae bacterium]|nr:hypothetical protein [Longimicrobiaceae bacterium]